MSCLAINNPTIEVFPQRERIVEFFPTGLPGPPGLSGDGISVIGEVPAGAINGSNATFTTQFSFVPESVEVFINGLRQHRPAHFTTTGTATILLSDSPQVGELIQVNYLRA